MTQTKTYASEYDRFLDEANWIIGCDKRSLEPTPYFSKSAGNDNPFYKARQLELEYFYSYREATDYALDDILTTEYHAVCDKQMTTYGQEYEARQNYNAYNDAYNNSVDLYLSKGP